MSANNNVNVTGIISQMNQLEGAEGKERLSFNIAVKKPYKVKEGEQDAFFFRVQAWGKLAMNISKYVGVGCKVSVQGHLVSGSYKNKEGATVYTTDIKVDDISFLSFKDAKPEETASQPLPAQQPMPEQTAPQQMQQPSPQPVQSAPQQMQQPSPQPAPPQQMTTAQLQAAADQLTDDEIPF